jgi:hypothetical protein
MTLYRGHKDTDYLKTKYLALSFTENIILAKAYGLGQNDSGNASVTDGYATTVSFTGSIINVAENGLGNVDKYIHIYKSYDGAKFKDGVIAVLNRNCLTHINTIKASGI